MCQFDSLVYEQLSKIINLSNLHERYIIVIVNLRGNKTIIVRLNSLLILKSSSFKTLEKLC